MRAVWPRIQPQEPFQQPSQDPHWREALQVRDLREGLFSQGLSPLSHEGAQQG